MLCRLLPPALVCTLASLATAARPATRVSEPGPLLGRGDPGVKGKRSVLIIGDSISIGQMGRLGQLLGGGYAVQHGPAAGGGGALDVKHGAQHLEEFTRTAAMANTSFDAVSFNFGVHDADYSCYPGGGGAPGHAGAPGRPPCMPDEYTALPDYTRLLAQVKAGLLRLVPSPRRLVFALSTPICYNLTLNDRVLAFNEAARAVMAAPPAVAVHDTYALITGVCGNPPYNAPLWPGGMDHTCAIANVGNVHYQPGGWELLANSTAACVRGLFDAGGGGGADTVAPAPPAPAASAPPLVCQNVPGQHMPTSCPVVAGAASTCLPSKFSTTGVACCVGLGAGAVACGDSYHCCPKGMTCAAGNGGPCWFGGAGAGCFCK